MGSKDWRKQHSNLQCFLERSTPFVATTKTLMRDNVEGITLGDLWDQYYEWSAYGLGVPIRINKKETITQYYVPHLSAIQIYTNKSLASLRNVGEDSESDTWSDDNESEKLFKSWDGTSEDSASETDCLCPGKDRIGQLYCEYIEYCPPYGRIPLTDKVSELARSYPGLTSFRIADLSPASWMSISWYPIYHIPFTINVKGLSASFLTYHTISSTFQEHLGGEAKKDGSCIVSLEAANKSEEAISQVSLPPFGLATYKLQGSFWVNPKTGDHERIIALYSSAESWLKQLGVRHQDFNFFATHSTM